MKLIPSRICMVALVATLVSTPVWAAGGATAAPGTISGNAPSVPPQTGTCKGIVYDETGEPLIGATVQVEGTTLGTATDVDGRFSLSNVKEGSKIKISYIGYEPQTVVWNGQDLTVNLNNNNENLDELVVVGYGVQKKVNLVGSVSSVDSKQLEGRSGGSVSNMINGLMPGITITQSSGSPGADQASIYVRGVGSFGADSSPLVLVDGLPGNMNDLTPAEIESISVLKDAASAAIYGSRAANGVILITTKNGKEGKVKVTYNGKFGWSTAGDLPDVAHSYEYAEFMNMALGTEMYSKDVIAKYRDGSDPYNYPDEMYLQDLLGTHPFQTQQELGISGGNDRINYQVTGAYLRTNGFFDKSYYDRFNARVNLSAKLAKNLTMNVLANGTFGSRHEPSTPGSMDNTGNNAIIANALRFPGLWPSYNEEGVAGIGPKFQGTPIAWVDCNSFNKYDTDRFKGQINFNYEVIPGLNLKVIGGYNYTMGRNRYYRCDLPLANGSGSGPSTLNESWGRTAYKTFQALADYHNTFGKNYVGVLLGYTWEDEKNRNLGAYRTGYPSDDVPYISAGGADGMTNSGGGYDWAVQSMIGRLNYNFDERYLLEATFRYDGSSRFPKDKKYGFFPSVGAAWRITQEKFWENCDALQAITNLKLKATYGILGNNNIGNYPYQSVYALTSNYVFGGVYTQGAAITTYVDPNLEWEKTHTWDIGLESGFFNNKLTFNFTYFDRRTKDILYRPSASYSSIFGLGISEVNTGEVSNRGFEIELGHNNRIGNVDYHVNANFSYINNKVETLGVGNVEQPNGMVGNGSNLFIGYPMNFIYGYKTDGVFLTDEEAANYEIDQSAVNPNKRKAGDIRYLDLDGDGKVTAAKDRTYLGSTIPKYTFGLNAGLKWKGVDFSFLLQGVAGVKGRLSDYAAYAFYQEGNIQRWQMEGCWNVQPENRYPAYPRLEVMTSAGTNNTALSDFWVRDAWFLKCRNIQLGYTLPDNWVSGIGVKGLRVYMTLDNPFEFHDYPKGWDPEKRGNNGQYYPSMRTYTFGLTLNL